MRLLILILLFSSSAAFSATGNAQQEKAAETLVTLLGVISETSVSLEKVRMNLSQEGEDAPTVEEAEVLQSRESELAGRLVELKAQFDEVATGVREDDLVTAEEANLDLAEEVREILRPGVRAMKKATERPRETEQLRAREKRLQEQAALANEALARLEKWKDVDGEIEARIKALKDRWSGRKKDAEGQLEALEVQLEQREKEKGPILKPVSEAFGDFFKGRGLNLLKALGALFGTWFLLRWLSSVVRKLPVLRHIDKGDFSGRLLNLTTMFLSGLFAAIAALLVLYFSGDWLLLTLFLVFIVGLGWTAKSTIPRVFEQTKMLLNLGPVRKGERLTFEGVPWQVGTIGVYTELRNAELTGGLIRMSIKRLSTLRSRPHDECEAWFPSRIGDWVIVGERAAKVVMQTPEYVQIVRLGGARETFSTPDFLSLAPTNLSNNFRVKVTFGIDYAHQAISTTEVPMIFKAKITSGIVEILAEREHLNSVNVEFAEAGASSLDYAIMADFKGAAADRYEKLRRGVQRICVEVCNEKGWVIPFTQITVHQVRD